MEIERLLRMLNRSDRLARKQRRVRFLSTQALPCFADRSDQQPDALPTTLPSLAFHLPARSFVSPRAQIRNEYEIQRVF